MPGFDGTGPRGKGPMTGWARGYCAILISSPQPELSVFKNQVGDLRLQMEQMSERIDNLIKIEKEVRNARI